MSSTHTSTRPTERPTSTISRRESATRISTSTRSKEAPESTFRAQQVSSIQLDTENPTPSATPQDALDNVTNTTTASVPPSATCSTDSDCASSARFLDAAPFGSPGDSSLAPTTHMSTASAIGIGFGVVSIMVLIFGLVIWFYKRRERKPLNDSVEAPPPAPNRNRSASSATDQKTLVASLPNSPQNANFRQQHEQMLEASFAQLVTSNKIVDHSRREKEMIADEGRASTNGTNHQSSGSNEKILPLPPNDMPLPPPPPTEDKRYAINVNINKSMIFDDIVSVIGRDGGTPRDSTTSRDRMPKYRFEEYLPPVAKTPPISIRPKKRTSEIELKPYPRSSSSSARSVTDDEGDDETHLRRKNTLKKLESKPPQLPLPDLLPPPSPSFSYDWYQDIIGTEQTNMEDALLGTSTPSIPGRNPARTPTKATFGAALSSNPPDIDPTLLPAPLSPTVFTSPARASHLNPNTALPSPTSANFRLSPTVYTMPSRPPKAQPIRASLRSTTTQKTHMSRSWLPDDGLYLPEEGTHDSYMMYNKTQFHFSDDSRPTSYSPF